MPKTKQMMDIYFNSTPAYTARVESYNGGNHLIVPVVMMMEGVHNGSRGPVLHLASELGRMPESWNGIPVTIGHPRVNETYVSANSPTVLRDWAVGIIFNSRMDGTRLLAEAWIDQSRIQALSADTLTRIQNGEVMEVSVGILSDEEHTEGVHNNEAYSIIARNHRPDHLALLPGEVGACSIIDGCGLRVNKRGGKEVPEKTVIVNEENQQGVLKELNRKGFSINQVGFLERADKVQRLLDSMDSNGRIHWLDEILSETELVYRVDTRQEDGNRVSKYFRQTYIVKEDGNIELTGEPVEVKKEVAYTLVPQVNKKGSRTNFNNSKKKEVTIMAEKCTECVKAKVDGLIANKLVAYSEGNREWLETLTEGQLEIMTPQEVKEPQVNTESKKITREEILETLGLKTAKDFLSIMPTDLAEQMKSGQDLMANQKDAAVKAIIANTDKDLWSEDQLKGKSLTELTQIYKSCKVEINKEKENDFSGLGGGFTPVIEANAGVETEPLMPMGYEEIKKD